MQNIIFWINYRKWSVSENVAENEKVSYSDFFEMLAIATVERNNVFVIYGLVTILATIHKNKYVKILQVSTFTTVQVVSSKIWSISEVQGS